MATFVPRTTAPSASNSYYYADNPFYKAGYGMPNCTCYAWGRFYELSGQRPKLSTGDAEDWYDKADGYQRGKTPKLGAVICWSKGVVGDDSDGAGHVAIVEKINADGSIQTSNSAWGGSLFYMKDIGSNYALSGYSFQGFIYNPVNFGGGSFTPPDPISANRYLTLAEMQKNATYIYWYLSSRGWTLNAISGMLGNMEAESTINPGIWQNLAVDVGPAFGLVQWDPYTKYFTWCDERNLEPAEMDSALQRIEYELETGQQYYKTDSYPETFAEFKASTESPYYLACAFAWNYERSNVVLHGSEEAKEALRQERGGNAEYWYEYLSGLPPFGPGSGEKKKKTGFKFVLFGRKRRFLI